MTKLEKLHKKYLIKQSKMDQLKKELLDFGLVEYKEGEVNYLGFPKNMESKYDYVFFYVEVHTEYVYINTDCTGKRIFYDNHNLKKIMEKIENKIINILEERG